MEPHQGADRLRSEGVNLSVYTRYTYKFCTNSLLNTYNKQRLTPPSVYNFTHILFLYKPEGDDSVKQGIIEGDVLKWNTLDIWAEDGDDERIE